MVYELLQKSEAITKNFHSVYLQASLLTSPLSPVESDYNNRLDEMIPPIDTNFLSPYLILNIVKLMANNKAPGQDRITTIMVKNSSFKIILQIYYIIRSSAARILPKSMENGSRVGIPETRKVSSFSGKLPADKFY